MVSLCLFSLSRPDAILKNRIINNYCIINFRLAEEWRTDAISDVSDETFHKVTFWRSKRH